MQRELAAVSRQEGIWIESTSAQRSRLPCNRARAHRDCLRARVQMSKHRGDECDLVVAIYGGRANPTQSEGEPLD